MDSWIYVQEILFEKNRNHRFTCKKSLKLTGNCWFFFPRQILMLFWSLPWWNSNLVRLRKELLCLRVYWKIIQSGLTFGRYILICWWKEMNCNESGMHRYNLLLCAFEGLCFSVAVFVTVKTHLIFLLPRQIYIDCHSLSSFKSPSWFAPTELYLKR